MSRYSRFRRANSSLPGYDNLGWEDFGHPASKAQPGVDDYGIDSEFGEGVRKGPYRSGPAPASYGWEPDHPAMRESLGQDFEETHDLYDANLKKAMERKASKCIEIAENRLGKYASQDEVEELALRYMDLPSRSINAKLQRIASEQYAGDEMQEATGYEGDDFGPGNVMADDIEGEMVSPAEILAEEIATLKAANRRLASEIRRVAEDSVQKATGYMGHDMGEDDFDDESEGPTTRLADELNAHGLFDEYDMDGDGYISRDEWGGSSSVFDEIDEDMDGMLSRDEVAYGVGRSFAEDMDQLSEMMAEAHEAGDEEAMAEILAEMEMLAGPEGNKGMTKGMNYKKHNSYGEAAPGFGYQDPDTRAKNRRDGKSEWDGRTKHFHNLNYYSKNKELWKKKASDFLADDILSDDEFASMVAELETMAGGPGSGGNNKGSRKTINQYGEAAPGFGYQDPDTRAKNRRDRKSEWDGRTKDFYNKNYYSANRGKIEGWPTPQNPRVAEMMAEDMLADEEQAMLAEMIAEMEAGDHEAGDHEAGNHGHMAGNHGHMAGDHEAGMGHFTAGQDHMGLDMSAEETEAGLDPKLARIFQAAEEVSEETEAGEEEADIQMAEEETTATKKSASFRPQTQARQASVKTLGNISREASSATDELSKLWESAPDVSKYFG